MWVIGAWDWWGGLSAAGAEAKRVVVLQVSQQALAKPVPGNHLMAKQRVTCM